LSAAVSSKKNNSRSVHNRGANDGKNEKPDGFLSILAADVVKLIRKNYSKKKAAPFPEPQVWGEFDNALFNALNYVYLRASECRPRAFGSGDVE